MTSQMSKLGRCAAHQTLEVSGEALVERDPHSIDLELRRQKMTTNKTSSKPNAVAQAFEEKNNSMSQSRQKSQKRQSGTGF